VTQHRPVWAEVDLGAIAANVRALVAMSAPAGVLAVVKADAYGHGAVPVSRAVLEAGAAGVGVALVEEGVELRDAGIADALIIVLSEPVPDAAETVVERRLTPVVYTAAGIEALAKAVVRTGATEPLDVHLKVDTGMHRVGCTPSDALDLARQVAARPELRLAGVCTHFAVADEPDNEYTARQEALFTTVLADLRAAGIDPGIVHACNTAGAIARPGARYDMVRAGIGVYGVAPSPALAGQVPLQPALALKAQVSYVKTLPRGARVSYGLRYETTDADTTIATVPIGYADGVPRALGHRGAQVIVRGTRRPIAGTITMDQLMLDADGLPIEVGDEVVLLGSQGDESVTAEEWAELLDTIGYEIVCGIGPRVPRRYLG
jgi:alanine racemase